MAFLRFLDLRRLIVLPLKKVHTKSNGECGGSLGAYGCLIFAWFLVILRVGFVSLSHEPFFFVLNCSSMRVSARSFFLSSRGLISSFSFIRGQVSWRPDDDCGVYSARPSSSSPSVVGASVIAVRPIGVVLIGCFFACGVDFSLGSDCL